MKHLFTCAALGCMMMAGSVFAQGTQTSGTAVANERPLPAGRSMMNQAPKVYADSNEFNALWKDFYPTIKPEGDIKERVARQFKSAARGMKERGVDSAEAFGKVMAQIDPTMDEKASFQAYRTALSAAEFKIYLDLMKTPTGKHLLEVAPRLNGAKNAGDAQIRKAIMTVVPPPTPAERAAMMANRPNGGANGGNARVMPDAKNPGMMRNMPDSKNPLAPKAETKKPEAKKAEKK